MWLRRKLFDDLREELAAERARREAAEKHLAIAEQHRAWMAEQVNRLEAERSLLLQRTIGVTFPVPEVIPTPARAPETTPLVNVKGKPLSDIVPGIDVGALKLGAAAFEDMGDDEAERQGVGPSEIVVQLTS